MSSPGVQPESVVLTATGPETKSVRWMQALILAMLYSFPVFVCARNATVADPDIWWHMRTGEWILRHGFPHTDPFSSFGAGKPWAAYSWLFDLIVFRLHQSLGLAGIVTYTAAMVTAITVALHRMIRRLCPDFTMGVLLTLAASVCMEHLWTPRSWLFTVLFFAVELDVLMRARQTGKSGALWWLPVLFAIWASLHIQFLYGLVVLAIALVESLLNRRWNSGGSRIETGKMGAVLLACVGATLANPYGWGVYLTAWGLGSQKGVLSTVTEMTAMPFRDIGDYGVLFFTIAAVVVLARSRRRQVFEVLLMAFAVLVSFRSQRDVWVMAIAASAIVGGALGSSEEPRSRVSALAAPAAVLITVAFAPLFFRALGVNNSQLSAKLGEKMPVKAAEYVKSKGLQGPLFNDYDWGGYLMWNPRLAVSIDGRAALAGDKLIAQTLATWEGARGWNCNPDLRNARLVIGPVEAPLTQLLRTSPGFHLAYEDQVAAVFVARPGALPAATDAQAGFPCTNAHR